jgi:hypothetical protein
VRMALELLDRVAGGLRARRHRLRLHQLGCGVAFDGDRRPRRRGRHRPRGDRISCRLRTWWRCCGWRSRHHSVRPPRPRPARLTSTQLRRRAVSREREIGGVSAAVRFVGPAV